MTWTSLLEFFLPDAWGSWALAMALFGVLSVVTIWLLAMIFARMPLVARDDLELKIHFGVAAALVAYGVVTMGFVLLLAVEYRTRDLTILWIVPWCLHDLCVLLLAISLAGQIRARASSIGHGGLSR